MPDTLHLLLGLLFSSIGLGYFIYGRKQDHKPALLWGLLLIVYPYFIASKLILAAIGLLLMAIPLYFKR